MDWNIYKKLSKVSDWALSHPLVKKSGCNDKEVTVTNRDGEEKVYRLADYASVEELAAAIASEWGFVDTFGQARGSKRGKYYFFNMANEWEDIIIGNLTNGGYKEVDDPEDAEKTTMHYASDGISDWIADVGDDDPNFDAQSFVLKATKEGHAEYTFHREDDDDYTLKLTVVNDPSEYEYFE